MFMLMLVTPVSLYGIKESLTIAIRIRCHILFILMLVTSVRLNFIEESLTKAIRVSNCNIMFMLMLVTLESVSMI